MNHTYANDDDQLLAGIVDCDKLLTRANAHYDQILTAAGRAAPELAPSRVRELSSAHRKRECT